MNFDESENLTVDYSPDDEEIGVADPTRDTLAEGLMARLLRPCVDRLDMCVQSTRLSQLNLKLQLDSLAAELKSLSLSQHIVILPRLPIANDKASNLLAPVNIDTCTLLDGYGRRLSSIRAKIAVVGNILESTQERLRALSHRIGREHNNRRSLLEPPTVTGTSEKLELDNCVDKLKDEDFKKLLIQDTEAKQDVENVDCGRSFEESISIDTPLSTLEKSESS